MYREIRLPQDTRYFEKAGQGSRLCRTGKSLAAGTMLTVSPPETMIYDHKDQNTVSFTIGGKTYFMIVDEMNIPALAGQ